MEDKDKEKAKMEEKKDQWESFVRKAKLKTANHTTMVRFYNAIYNMMILSVILLAGILTCAILLGGIDKMVLAALSATCTILTATSKFLVADRKKAGHKRFFKLFQTLLIRMLRCETVAEYNILWHELHEAIIREPLVLIWQRRSKKISVDFAMAPRLVLAFEGKEEPVPSNVMPQHGYRDGYRASIGNRPDEFNPHDFHMMSIDERSQNQQQVPNRRDGYVAISGFEEQKMKTPRKSTMAEKIPGEKTSMTASQSKSKRKKSKADSEKSFQSRQPHSGFSSQATLDEIEEEQELEEQQNIPETSDSVALTEQRTGKKKKGQNHQTKSSAQDLPPPPPLEEDEDEYIEQESKQVNTTKLNPTSSKNFRATTSRNDHRSIVYNEEEENELSEDSDELDENEDMTSYTRN